MTFSNRNSIKFILFFVLVISIGQFCEALANHAIYTIENQGSSQCLSAGGVMKSADNSNLTLFKHGHAISKPCADISSLNSTDFSQQWMVRIQKENPRNLTYQIQLAMLNTLYYDANLTAEIRGEFIMYFPDQLDLRARHPVNESTQSQEFVISEPGTENCLGEKGKETGIQFEKCDHNEHFQLWTFTLVNEKINMGAYFNMSSPST